MSKFLIFDTCEDKTIEEMELMRSELSKPFRPDPAQGSRRRTTTGRPYLWGPRFDEIVDVWPAFVMSVHGLKSSGMVLQYANSQEPEPTYWSSKLYRTAIKPPMTEACAAWIAKEIRDRGIGTAVVASASLVEDLLHVACQNNINLSGAVFMTTFEVSTTAKFKAAHSAGCKIIEFMREWFGGLTIYRCPQNKMHVVESACVVETKDDGSILCTDPHNKAQYFKKYDTGHKGLIVKDEKCLCGSPNATIEIHKWASGFLSDGTYVPSEFGTWPQNGWQVLERKDGSLLVLSRRGLSDAKKSTEALLNKVKSLQERNVYFGEGYILKGGKLPPVVIESSVFEPRMLSIKSGCVRKLILEKRPLVI